MGQNMIIILKFCFLIIGCNKEYVKLFDYNTIEFNTPFVP